MRFSLILISAILFLAACRKKETNTPTEVTTTKNTAYTTKDYMPLKYGNYWVYQLTKTDTNNVVTYSAIDSTSVYDSLFTSGKWFYKTSGNSFNSDYYIDSAANIIVPDGKRVLSLTNNDTLNKVSYSSPGGWYDIYNIMKTSPTTFVFNSTTYSNCINRFSYFYSNMNPNCPNWVIYNTYCPGVGLVYSKYGFINSCDVWELKLLRYKIN